MKKRLYRSETDKKVSGVCAGIADYFDVDPVLIRVLAVLLIVVTGIFPGMVAYFIMSWVMPLKSEIKNG